MGKKKKRKIEIVNNTFLEVDTASDKKQDDKEQRRSNRLSTILAIIAVSGTVYSVVYKYARGFLNIYSQNGIIFNIFQNLFFVALSAIFLTLFDIVSFVFSDLNRYNILKDGYADYDEKSDKKYNILIRNFIFYIIIILYFFFTLIMMFAWLSEENMSKFLFVLILSMMIYVGYCLVRYAIKKKEIKNYVFIGFRGLVVFWICLLFVANIIDNRTSVVCATFEDDGKVIVFDETVYTYDEFTIEIYNSDMKLIFSKHVDCNEVLYASEDSFISNKVGNEWTEEGHIIDAQERYWKYYFSLDEIITEDGQYQVTIGIEEENSSVKLKNDLYKNKGNYTYAMETITKEY